MTGSENLGLDIDWQQSETEIQVTVVGRFTAADGRHMHVDYNIDSDKQIVALHCRVEFKGRRYHHDSVLRGFCVIPKSEFKQIDPNTCDWSAELI